MQYMIMLRQPPGAGPQEGTPEFDAEMKRWGELIDELREAGVLVGASGLQGDAVTTRARAAAGELTVTDGPYAETKELLFSFYHARRRRTSTRRPRGRRRCPRSAYGSIEIRPLVGSLAWVRAG